jgi:hypothetical protein
MWIAVPGVVLLARPRALRWLVLPLLFCAAVELYVSSAALDYEGARRMLNLTPIAAMSMALVLQRFARWTAARPGRLGACAAAGLLLVVLWGTASVSLGYSHGKLGWDRPLLMSERIGEGEKQTMALSEDAVGPLEVLPAAWVFALRYHLKPRAFGWASHPQWYDRDMRTLEYNRSDFAINASEARDLLRGFRFPDNSPACIADRDAAAVFAAQWPFATRIRLTYDATQPVTLSVGSRSFFGSRTSWGSEALRAGKNFKAFFRIPPGGFDSGINELEFRIAGEPGTVCVHSLEMIDDAHYAAAPEADASPPIILFHGEEVRGGDVALPSVAVGSTPATPWVVEVNEAPGGKMAYASGRPGEYSSPSTFAERGARPRVVAGDGETVLEVEQGQAGAGSLWARTGRVDPTSLGVTWLTRTPLANGYHPVVGAARGRALEVQMDDADGTTMSFRTASYDASGLHWGDAHDLGGAGFEPAIAVAPWPGTEADDVVVEVHQEKAAFGAMWLRTGRLDAAGNVTWRPPVEYDHGVFPSVTVFGRTVVEVHQGQDDSGSLWMKVGTLDADGAILWRTNHQYDSGAHPVLSADAASGKAVEAHQGKLGMTAMWSRAGEVY